MTARCLRAVLVAALLTTQPGCASQKPAPAPAPPPDASQKLVADITQWLHLDGPQQGKTLELAREMAERNQKIEQRWQQTQRPHVEEMAASRAKFQADLFAILTPEQQKIYRDTVLRVMMKGKTPPKTPS
jgi:Spy/CpxP family protein refolding chaperone